MKSVPANMYINRIEKKTISRIDPPLRLLEVSFAPLHLFGQQQTDRKVASYLIEKKFNKIPISLGKNLLHKLS
jgi:hypothetical protein